MGAGTGVSVTLAWPYQSKATSAWYGKVCHASAVVLPATQAHGMHMCMCTHVCVTHSVCHSGFLAQRTLRGSAWGVLRDAGGDND